MSEGGGWTVFQRRSDGSQDFDRVWTDYEEGFGNFVLPNGEYWLGNKNLHYLTNQGNYTLRIDLTDFEGERRFAQYARFGVAGEEHSYEMSCGEYSGTAGDSLTGGFHPEVKWWADHRGMKFSTRDRDNDNYEGNCAEEEKAGWWFNRCHSANLNGLYYKGPYTAKTDNGIVWYTWHGWWYSLKSVVMKDEIQHVIVTSSETKLCEFPALPGLTYLHCCVPAMIPLLFFPDVICFYFSHLNYHEIQGNFYWSEAHLYIIT
ncbi:fibrinogen-like protein 1 isoform X6 [Caloenas nicobarica]